MRRRFPRKRFRYERRPPWARPEGFGDIRPRGPLLRGRMLNPRLQRELRRANHLLAIGDHANAGRIFQDLALRARDHDIIYPAPMLFIRAAHAYLLGEDFDLSLESAEAGFDMLIAQERWRALRFESDAYLQELEAAGKKKEADELRAHLKASPVPAAAPEEETQATTLPEKCPYCGASMSLEQINAGGGKAAECGYCGSVVVPRLAE
jgi:hypothetical protein